jgi:hypothetical protein
MRVNRHFWSCVVKGHETGECYAVNESSVKNSEAIDVLL